MTQTLFVLIAGAGTWWLTRITNLGVAPRAAAIITAGFLGRALAGAALFWISYLGLPIARGMQAGNGIWFFGLDGAVYRSFVQWAAAMGFPGMLLLPRSIASVTYVQLLALAEMSFGFVTSSSLLLNLLAYLVSCFVVTRWARRCGMAGSAAELIPLVILAIAPGNFLWSLQPLKETVFYFFIVAAFASLYACQSAWLGRDTPRDEAVVAGVALGVVFFLLSGMRWYYGFALLVATALVAVFVVVLRSRRKFLATAVALALLVALRYALVIAAGPFLPPQIEATLGVKGFSLDTIRMLIAHSEMTRGGFDLSGGGTLIQTPGVPATAAGTVGMPSSSEVPVSGLALRRLASGFFASFIPLSVGERLGVLAVPGGRGLKWFADIDTIFCSGVILAGLVFMRRRGSPRSPLFWIVVATAVFVAVPMMYTVSNFGTLFRLRGVVYTTAALIPLAYASRLSPVPMADSPQPTADS